MADWNRPQHPLYWHVHPSTKGSGETESLHERIWTNRKPNFASQKNHCFAGYQVYKDTQMLHVWNIYLHLPQKWPSFVGRYSSTMVHIWDMCDTTNGSIPIKKSPAPHFWNLEAHYVKIGCGNNSNVPRRNHTMFLASWIAKFIYNSTFTMVYDTQVTN